MIHNVMGSPAGLGPLQGLYINIQNYNFILILESYATILQILFILFRMETCRMRLQFCVTDSKNNALHNISQHFK